MKRMTRPSSGLTNDVLDVITRDVIRAALRVHSALGPGVLERAYAVCLAHEMRSRGRSVETEVAIPVRYDGVCLDVGFRADLLVDSVVLVEVKAVPRLLPVHEAQLRSYLRLSERRVGLLINFHSSRLTSGIKRLVNGW